MVLRVEGLLRQAADRDRENQSVHFPDYSTFEPNPPSVSHWLSGGSMLKQLLSGVLAVAAVSQGTARADPPVPSAQVVVARDRVALLAHLDAMTAGDRVVVAT